MAEAADTYLTAAREEFWLEAAPRPPAAGRKGEPAMTTITVTVTVWHNIARDHEGRHTGMLDGYQPGDPMVRVFTYQADPAGRPPEDIAAEAFALYAGVDLVRVES